MLPGFRFLFAAVTLSISILVFGLGAAALLRTAHEEFAANPSWRTTPEPPIMVQQSEARPVLAMLRFDPPHPVPRANEPPPDQGDIVALNTKDIAPTIEATKAEAAPSPPPTVNEARPALVTPDDGTLKDDEIKIAALDAAKAVVDTPSRVTGTAEPETSPQSIAPENAKVEATTSATAKTEIAASEPSRPESEISALTPAFEPARNPAATKIATLGGPAITIEEAVTKKAGGDQAERSAKAQRRAEARAKARRRAALRARLARQQALAQQAAAQQQQADNPFGSTPTSTPTPAPARTR